MGLSLQATSCTLQLVIWSIINMKVSIVVALNMWSCSLNVGYQLLYPHELIIHVLSVKNLFYLFSRSLSDLLLKPWLVFVYWPNCVLCCFMLSAVECHGQPQGEWCHCHRGRTANSGWSLHVRPLGHGHSDWWKGEKHQCDWLIIYRYMFVDQWLT